MKLKKILSVVLAAVTAIAAAGCSANNTTSGEITTTTAAAGTEDVSTAETTVGEAAIPEGLTLKVLVNRTDRVNDGSLDAITDAFEEKYKCTVEYQGYKDYANDVSTMMSTSDYGDVLMIPDTVKLVDLNSYFEPLGTYSEIDENYFWADKKMYDNTVYGIAYMGTVQGGFCYNKKVWADAGITTLPTTPEEFIADLKLIRDNTDAIPFFSNFGASWAIAQWPSLVMSASGNPDFENEMLINGYPLFEEGNAYYNVYKLMFDIFSDKTLIEEDYSSDQWEETKPAINEGRIATMMMGSWAVSQFQEAGDNPDDIGFMPAPFSVDGKQYAESAADYCLGINKNRDADTKALAKKYIEWFIGESGFAQSEGGICALKGGEMPAYLEAFANCEMFIKTPAPEGLTGVWDQIEKVDAAIGLWLDDASNFKNQIAEAAFNGESFDTVEAIFTALNEKLSATRAENADVQAYLAAND